MFISADVYPRGKLYQYFGGDWIMVKRTDEADLADGSLISDDNLSGQAINGVSAHDLIFGASFTANFEERAEKYNQLLFATGTCSKFIFTDKDSVRKFYEKSEKSHSFWIKSSHLDQSEHNVQLWGGSNSHTKFPIIAGMDVDESNAASDGILSETLYSEEVKDAKNPGFNGRGLNVFVRKSNDEWTEWADSGLCSQTCGGGRQLRIRECRDLNYGTVSPDRFCEGVPTENVLCNHQPCPRKGSCFCDDFPNAIRCKSPFCGRGEECELHSWFQAKVQ